MTFTRRAAAAGLLGLLLAGCAGGSPSSGTVTASGAPEVTELTVGVLPIADVAPVYLAIEEGLFAAEGLTVTTEVMQGGAAAIPALVSGDLDVAYGNWLSFLLANQEGIPLRAIADGVAAAPGFAEFLALPDSGLGGNPGGLAGTRIAINTLNNIGELVVRTTLEAAGVDPASVELVEIPFPDMGAALERGDVDVIWAVEPGVSAAKEELGAVTVVDSFAAGMAGFPVAGYQVSADFAARNPNTVAAFRRAIQRAAQLAGDDRALLIETVEGYANLRAGLAGELSYPAYRARLEAATLRRVYDAMVEHGFADPGLDVASLVLAGP